MIRLAIVTLTAMLTAATPVAAACRWFGTQVECDVGASRVVIGTQTVSEPAYAAPFRPQPFHAADRLLGERAATRLPFEVDLQDFGGDASFCTMFGNETYCY